MVSVVSVSSFESNPAVSSVSASEPVSNPAVSVVSVSSFESNPAVSVVSVSSFESNPAVSSVSASSFESNPAVSSVSASSFESNPAVSSVSASSFESNPAVSVVSVSSLDSISFVSNILTSLKYFTSKTSGVRKVVMRTFRNSSKSTSDNTSIPFNATFNTSLVMSCSTKSGSLITSIIFSCISVANFSFDSVDSNSDVFDIIEELEKACISPSNTDFICSSNTFSDAFTDFICSSNTFSDAFAEFGFVSRFLS